MTAETAFVIAVVEKLAAPIALTVGGVAIKIWRDVHLLNGRQKELHDEMTSEVSAMLTEIQRLAREYGEIKVALVKVDSRVAAVEERYVDIIRRLERLDGKIDTLLHNISQRH